MAREITRVSLTITKLAYPDYRFPYLANQMGQNTGPSHEEAEMAEPRPSRKRDPHGMVSYSSNLSSNRS
jgi:hypothetical protein